ncbi:MAG: TIGR03663 family protein [Phycisphaerae bacterium]|jgi:uncharacterized protein (TIGR03663 family)|nr:TIGR03663 family protein [Phycisphaerae bacterium]
MKHPAASLGVLILVVAGAAAIRLVCLDNRPMHTDEAVHAFKFGQLLEDGTYKYDPHEYHGPTLNYLTIPVVLLGGGNTLAQTTETHLRLVPAICGILLIAGLWLVRDAIGRTAMLCAAVLGAVSPAMVFYSRYYIQEMLLVCFTFFAIAALWRCASRRQVARIAWLILAGLCAGLMHATKETCIIAFFAMVVAGGVVALLSLCQGNGWTRRKAKSLAISGGIVFVVGAVVSATFMSSLFTNPGGIVDSIATYFGYFTRAGGAGSAGDHSNPWYNYLRIITWWQVDDGAAWTEAFVVVLAVVGLVAGLIGKGCGKASIPFVRFLCVYTLVMTVVYSVISYKTPWCLLGFFHGMILLAGLGAAILLRLAKPAPLKAVVAVVLLAGTGHLAWQGWRGSFPQCADPGNPYVYAHATYDVPELARHVRGIANLHPDGRNMHVQIICADNHPWPFPWYLRDFPNLDMRVTDEKGRILPWPLAPVFIYRPDLSEDVNDTITIKMLRSSPYGWLRPETPEGQKPRDWELRPNAPLHVRVNRKLLEKYNATQTGGSK